MEMSVIIPLYNRRKTISMVLDSIFESTFKDFEVIVIDDASTDDSLDIARCYPIQYGRFDKNQGVSVARNTGAKQASGDILVFIDSDVLIGRDTLQKIHDDFMVDFIHCVFGMPKFDNESRTIFGNHFNWRVCFNFTLLTNHPDIAWGSLLAVRKSAFNEVGGFNESKGSIGIEDNEFGYAIHKNGIIYHDKSLLVTHLKDMSFLELLKNDFNRTLVRVSLLFRKKKLKSILLKKRFITTPADQLLSPFCAFLTLANPLFFFAFLATQYRYLLFLVNRRRGKEALKLIPILFVDMLVVFFALVAGVTRCLL